MKTINLILLSLTLSLLIQCKNAPEMSQWRGPERNGIYPEKNLLKTWPKEGPQMLWKYEDLGQGYSSVAVVSDKVYTVGTIDSTCYIFSFDHSGKLLWKKQYGKMWSVNYPGVRSTPLIYDGRGYLLSALGKLICFDAENGDFIWTKDLFKDFDGQNISWGITENLLIDGEKLFCTPGGTDANVIALNRLTGGLIWKSKGKGEKSAYCSPLLMNYKGKKYLVTSTEKSILSLNAENGELEWSHDLIDKFRIHANTPIHKDDYLFTINSMGAESVMFKIVNNGTAVEEVWKSKLLDVEHGDAILIGENLYGTSQSDKEFSCIDMKTGEVKQVVKELAPGSVIAADGMIYCLSFAGEMGLIQPNENGFEIISRFKVPGEKRDHIAHPVIKDGKMYVRYSNGLYVYSIAQS